MPDPISLTKQPVLSVKLVDSPLTVTVRALLLGERLTEEFFS